MITQRYLKNYLFNTNSHELKAEFPRIIRGNSIKISVDSCQRYFFKVLTQILLVTVLVLGLAGIGVAVAAEVKTKELKTKEVKAKEVKVEEKVEKIEKVTKEITGEVTGISKNFIAVEYGIDLKEGAALEMAFNIGKDIKIEYKNTLSEIGQGDTVAVTYEEITTKDKEGKIKRIERLPKVIKFMKKAKPIIEETEKLESRELEEQ